MKNFLVFLIVILFHQTTRAQTLIPFLKDGLYGYADENGKLIIPAQFDDASLFGNFNCMFEFSDYGNKFSGKYIKNIASVKLNDKYILINRKGEALFPEYENAYSALPVKELIVDDGQEIIQPLEYLIKIINTERQWGLYDLRTGYFSGFNFTSYSNPERNYNYRYDNLDFIAGYMIAKNLQGQFDLVDKEYNVIIESADEIKEKDYIFSYVKNSISYTLGNSKSSNYKIWGKLTNTPYVVIGTSRQKSNLGLIDLRGNIIIDTIYSQIDFLNNKILASKYKNEEYTTKTIVDSYEFSDLYNLDGKKISMPNLIYINEMVDQKYIYNFKNDYSEIRDSTNKIIKSFEKNISYFKGIQSSYTKGNLLGLMDNNFTTIIEYPADKIKVFNTSEKYFSIKIDNKYGIIDINGNVVFEPKYNEVRHLRNDIFIVHDKTGHSVTDSKGKVYLKTEERRDYKYIFGKDYLSHRLIDTIIIHDFENKILKKVNILDPSWRIPNEVKTKNNKKIIVGFYGLASSEFKYDYIINDEYYFGVIDSKNYSIEYYTKELDLIGGKHFKYPENGYLQVAGKGGHFRISVDNKVGLIDQYGKWQILPGTYYDIIIKNDLIHLYESKDVITKVLNVYLREVTPEKEDYKRENKMNIRDHEHYLASSKVKGGDKVYIMDNGSFDHSKTIYEKKYGIVNKKGEEIIPIEYDDINMHFNYYVATKDSSEKENDVSSVYNPEGDLIFTTHSKIDHVENPSKYITRRCYFYGQGKNYTYLFNEKGIALDSFPANLTYNKKNISTNNNKIKKLFGTPFFIESNDSDAMVNLLNETGDVIVDSIKESYLNREYLKPIDFENYLLTIENRLIILNKKEGSLTDRMLSSSFIIRNFKCSKSYYDKGLILISLNDKFFYFDYLNDILYKDEKI